MAFTFQEKDRQLIPRWRKFAATVKQREADPLKSREADPARNAEEVAQRIEEALNSTSDAVKADAISVAIALGRPDAATALAKQWSDGKSLSHALLDVVHAAGVGPVGQANHLKTDVVLPDSVLIAAEIARLKKRRILDPRNAFTWCDLALHFETLGQHAKADDAMRAARTLAPLNRSILRAHARLLNHRDRHDLAHKILASSPLIVSDPWIMAAEMATASVAGKHSLIASRAKKFIERTDLSPFHLSEINAALAMSEAGAGNVKRAVKLFRQSIVDPTENAIAQVSWAERNLKVDIANYDDSRALTSNEAAASEAFFKNQWRESANACYRWLREQPFSSRPAILLSHVLSVALSDYGAAKSVIAFSLKANPHEFILWNNLAYVDALSGDIQAARDALARAAHEISAARDRGFLQATTGLVEFRSNNEALGRELYRSAFRLFAQIGDQLAATTCLGYWLLEELRVRNSEMKDAAIAWCQSVDKDAEAAPAISAVRNKLLTLLADWVSDTGAIDDHGRREA